MKRHGNLFERVADRDNIYLAYKKARKGKSWQEDSHQKKGTQYLTIHFELENKRCITFTGSTVLMDQLNKYESHIPFISTIKKINRHYTFS